MPLPRSIGESVLGSKNGSPAPYGLQKGMR